MSSFRPANVISHTYWMIFSQTGRAHLLLISRTPGQAGGAIGVITLEGVCRDFFSKFLSLADSFAVCLLKISLRRSSRKKLSMRQINSAITIQSLKQGARPHLLSCGGAVHSHLAVCVPVSLIPVSELSSGGKTRLWGSSTKAHNYLPTAAQCL